MQMANGPSKALTIWLTNYHMNQVFSMTKDCASPLTNVYVIYGVLLLCMIIISAANCCSIRSWLVFFFFFSCGGIATQPLWLDSSHLDRNYSWCDRRNCRWRWIARRHGGQNCQLTRTCTAVCRAKLRDKFRPAKWCAKQCETLAK